MNANKHTFIMTAATLAALVSTSFSGPALALDAHSNTKVNNAMAKKWASDGGSNTAPVNPAQQNKQVVNFGSKRNNTCNVNVGTAKPGDKTKEIVVTTKEVINVCK